VVIKHLHSGANDIPQTQPRSLSGIYTDLLDYAYSIAEQSLLHLSNLPQALCCDSTPQTSPVRPFSCFEFHHGNRGSHSKEGEVKVRERIIKA